MAEAPQSSLQQFSKDETINSEKVIYNWDDLSPAHLSEYFAWHCPIHEENLVSLIAREISEYAGNDIELACVAPYDSECSKKVPNPFRGACVSNNGVCYFYHNWGVSVGCVETGTISRIASYICPKIYSQSLVARRRSKYDCILGINVIDTDNNDNDIKNRKDINNHNLCLRLMEKAHKSNTIYLNSMTNQRFVTKAKSSSNNDDNNDNDSDSIKWDYKNLKNNLFKWHEIVSKQTIRKVNESKEATTLYRIEKNTFIFCHNSFNLFCYNSVYFNKIGQNKCIIVNEDLHSPKSCIIDCWRYNDKLFLLRGTTHRQIKHRNEIVSGYKEQMQMFTQTDSNDNDKKNESETKTDTQMEKEEKKQENSKTQYFDAFEKSAIGRCQLFEINVKAKGNELNEDCIDCKQLFSFQSEFIDKKCNYFNESNECLLVICENKKLKQIEFRCFTKDNKEGFEIKVGKDGQLLLQYCTKGEYLFYHKLNGKLMLLTRLRATKETSQLFSSNKLAQTAKSRKKVARILIEFDIDFDKLCLRSMKYGFVKLSHDIGKMVAFDDRRCCMIFSRKAAHKIKRRSFTNLDKYKGAIQDWENGVSSSNSDGNGDEYFRTETNYPVYRVNDVVFNWKLVQV